MNTTKTISIEFGALSKPIKEQLENQEETIRDADADRFEQIAQAIILLHLTHIIPDSVRNTSQQKLMKMISIAIHEGWTPPEVTAKNDTD